METFSKLRLSDAVRIRAKVNILFSKINVF